MNSRKSRSPFVLAGINKKRTRADAATAGVVAGISANEARNFLERLANLPDEPERIERFRNNFGRWFAVRSEHLANAAGELTEESVLAAFQQPIIQTRNLVRSIWMTRGMRERDMLARFLLGFVEQNLVRVPTDLWQHLQHAIALGEVYPPSAIEEAAHYLLSSLDCLGKCQNPGCPEPLFFLAHRNQRFCSPECSLPSKQESKRRWWEEHGQKWRNKREDGKSKRKRGK